MTISKYQQFILNALTSQDLTGNILKNPRDSIHDILTNRLSLEDLEDFTQEILNDEELSECMINYFPNILVKIFDALYINDSKHIFQDSFDVFSKISLKDSRFEIHKKNFVLRKPGAMRPGFEY